MPPPVPLSTEGPGPMLATLHAALGHEPSSSVVLVGFSEAHPSAAVILEVDADEDWGQLISRAATQLADDGATEAVVADYDPMWDAYPERTAAQYAAGCLEAEGIRVRDALCITGPAGARRWRSYGCSASCCPPGGTPVPTLDPGATHA